MAPSYDDQPKMGKTIAAREGSKKMYRLKVSSPHSPKLWDVWEEAKERSVKVYTDEEIAAYITNNCFLDRAER
jgi:predicted peroxiredoxin